MLMFAIKAARTGTQEIVSRQGSKGSGKAIVSQQPSCYNSIGLVCSLVESRLIPINFPQRMQGCNVFNHVYQLEPKDFSFGLHCVETFC